MPEDDLTPFEKKLLLEAENSVKRSDERKKGIAARDEFVRENTKSNPVSDFLNPYIAKWNAKEGGYGVVRDAVGKALPGAHELDNFMDLLSVPKMNPKALAESQYALRGGVDDEAGRDAGNRNLKTALTVGTGLMGSGKGALQKTIVGGIDALQAMTAEPENWAPLTANLGQLGVAKIAGSGPMRKLLDLPQDRSLQQANSPLEVLKQFFKSPTDLGLNTSTAARTALPFAQGAAVDLAGQAGDPNTSFHTPVMGLLMGLPGAAGMALGQHAHNTKFETPTYANQKLQEEMERRLGMPVQQDAAGRASIGLTPAENQEFKNTVETAATRGIGRETIKDALENNKVAVQFKNDPDGVMKAFNQRLEENLLKLTESNPEFKALAEQHGPDYLKKLKEIGVSTWRSGGDPKGMSTATRSVVNAVDSAWKKTTSSIQKEHAGKIDLAKQSQADYLAELEKARLGETAPDIMAEQGQRSVNARYLKFDPLTGKTQQVPQGTPGALVFDDYAEGSRRFTPETVMDQQHALQEQVKTNTLGDNQFFRDLARSEFNKFVREAAKAADLPSDMARFSPTESKAWNSFKNLGDARAFTGKLFESPENLRTFVYHFGDDPKVMGMAKRQVSQQILDSSMNYKGPAAGSGGTVDNTAFDRMVDMDPKDFNRLMGDKTGESHKALLDVAEASKLARQALAESHPQIQAKDIVMLTLAGMYSMGASAGSQPLAFGFAAAAKTLGNAHYKRIKVMERLLNPKSGLDRMGSRIMKQYWENPGAFNGTKANLFTKWAESVTRTETEEDEQREKILSPRPAQ